MIAMLRVPAAHGITVVVAVKVISISILIFVPFMVFVVAPMIMPFFLTKCQAAAKREYGRDQYV
jgi:hypothetical protein